MPKISAKRQITLPVDQCRELDIQPGDEIEFFVSAGHLALIKKEAGAANGALRSIKGQTGISDEESRQSSLK